MNNWDIKFTVMTFTETWLNDDNTGLYIIEGYNMEAACRTTREMEEFLRIWQRV